ncbi:DarT ssDNA thymidine ADP-ribosyltransferase family protein [Rhizobium panacihumi]|uniref:DarT ssDNA thymidine ADP-ribosyltransferase family protein n=1 Tax=Rhizobium panacihumi TaxID=2008450 RepID=UPI003D7B815C
MAIDMLAKVPLLYHFTDRRNIPLIKEMGGLYPLSQLDQKQIKVPAPGGNQWSRDADAPKGMGNYVHLCFRNAHPMEYMARQDGRITDTIFLQIHPSVMQLEGVLFTNDVANKAGVESVAIADADALIDFEILYTRTEWRDPAIKARLTQAEKYEVLVPHIIPLPYIRNI